MQIDQHPEQNLITNYRSTFLGFYLSPQTCKCYVPTTASALATSTLWPPCACLHRSAMACSVDTSVVAWCYRLNDFRIWQPGVDAEYPASCGTGIDSFCQYSCILESLEVWPCIPSRYSQKVPGQ